MEIPRPEQKNKKRRTPREQQDYMFQILVGLSPKEFSAIAEVLDRREHGEFRAKNFINLHHPDRAEVAAKLIDADWEKMRYILSHNQIKPATEGVYRARSIEYEE